MIWYFLITFIFLSSYQVPSQFQYTNIGTLGISYPINTHSTGFNSSTGQVLKAILNWDQSTQVLYLKFAGNGTYINQIYGPPPLVYVETLTQNGMYTFKVQKLTSNLIFYQLNIYIDDVVVSSSTNLAVTSNNVKPIYKYDIYQTCQRAVFTSSQRSIFSNFYLFRPAIISNVINIDTDYTYSFDSTIQQIMVNLNQTGTWYFIPQDALSTAPQTTYSILQTGDIQIRCLLCGNRIRDDQQECDNGNITGCINCVIGTQFRCAGDVGQTSDCSCKTPRYYWNFAYATCVINCTDVLYANAPVSGSTDQCQCINSFFYNMFTQICSINCSSIAHAGQIIGVIDQCSCQLGYQWFSLQCLSRCGNGIKTQDEQCDDGNRINGDGCSDICVKQPQPTTTVLPSNLPIIIGSAVGGVVFLGILIVIIVIVYKKCVKKKRRKIKSKKNGVHDSSSQVVIQ